MNIFINKLRYLLVTIALLLGSVSSATLAAGYYNVGNWYQGLTVTYVSNNPTSGTAPAPTNYVSGTTFTVASNSGSLTKTGYTFAGWNTQADGNGVNYTAGAGAMTLGSDSVTLYAKWSINSYTVTYDGNGSTSGAAPVTASYNYNTTVTVSNNTGILARTGYTFAGWNTQANGTGTNYTAGTGSFTMGTANVTLYAQWNINSYTVTFNANGGTGSPSVASVSGNYNTNVTLATVGTLARTGYTFAGWNTAAAGNGTNYAAGASYTVTANITLYAQWNINSYTVTFNANGGIGSPSVASVSGNYNTNVTLATVGTLTRTGYTFAGWNTTIDGSGTNYTAGASYTVTANVTLYAKWNINSYTVTFNANGGTGSPSVASVSGNYNTNVTLATVGTLTRTGYTFAGWNTATDGSGTNYTAGASYTVTVNIALYARWATCGDTPANNCYSGTNAALLKGVGSGTTPTGKSLTWNTTASVWFESGAGTRVLAADGTDNWQPQLNADGRSFSASLVNKANVAGRACPGSVFISTVNMVASNRCLYYDGGSTTTQGLNAAGTTQTSPTIGLGAWNVAGTGNDTGASWYEGNIQICANKGMRVPTLYETTSNAPGASDGTTPATNRVPTDATPVWSGTRVPGVPGNYTWTASADVGSTGSYFRWSTSTSFAMSYSYSFLIRCVVPY